MNNKGALTDQQRNQIMAEAMYHVNCEILQELGIPREVIQESMMPDLTDCIRSIDALAAQEGLTRHDLQLRQGEIEHLTKMLVFYKEVRKVLIEAGLEAPFVNSLPGEVVSNCLEEMHNLAELENLDLSEVRLIADHETKQISMHKSDDKERAQLVKAGLEENLANEFPAEAVASYVESMDVYAKSMGVDVQEVRLETNHEEEAVHFYVCDDTARQQLVDAGLKQEVVQALSYRNVAAYTEQVENFVDKNKLGLDDVKLTLNQTTGKLHVFKASEYKKGFETASKWAANPASLKRHRKPDLKKPLLKPRNKKMGRR
jgi:hypothetical protein